MSSTGPEDGAAAACRRLAIVVSHPTQYYSPWFRWLSAHTDLELRVFYLWEFGVTSCRDAQFNTTFSWDVDLLSGYAHEFVPNIARDPGTHHFGGLRNPALTGRLQAWRPNALLLFGYKWASQLRVIVWARRRGIPLLFRGDSHFLGRGAPTPVIRWLLRRLYAQFASVLYVGAANRNYFTTLGVPGERLHFSPHAVDRTLFDPASPAQHARAASLRAALGIPSSARVILFAGKFVPAKQPVELLRAFLALNPSDAVLVFVGHGEEVSTLRTVAAGAPAGTVHFLPFANQSEMPGLYLLADVFVLPSRGYYETWGLAVNEAMEMGVPALVSDRVGCQPDLVTDGETGWVFHADAAGALAEKLAQALQAVRLERERYRQRTRARVGAYGYAQATDGLTRALAAINTGR